MSEKRAILYVDDEDTNLLLFRIAFESNYEVLLANSPEEGLQKLKENSDKIKAVISDMHMPSMNGVQFIEKAQEVVKDIPYFILSGFSYNGAIDLAVKQKKIKKFFTKPFDRSEIESYLGMTG